MKLKSLIISAGALLAAASGIAFANTTYYPPERIHCKMDNTGALHCEGFNHQFLIEANTTAELTARDQSFSFVSGVAYFTPNMSESTIYFTYKNADLKSVKLKTTSVLMRPDFSQGHWSKIQDDLFVCDAGYMSCPVKDSPDNIG